MPRGKPSELQLSQKRSALLAKFEMIKKLDGEIVDEVHVPEEELEDEIGWADEVQEQLELAIMEADGILQSQSGDLAPATSVSRADRNSLQP